MAEKASGNMSIIEVNWQNEIGVIAGPYDGNRKGWLSRAARRANVTYRTVKALCEAERQRKEVEKLNSNTDRVIALSAAEEFAQWIMARTDLNELPTIISWLEGTKPRDVIAAMRRAAA